MFIVPPFAKGGLGGIFWAVAVKFPISSLPLFLSPLPLGERGFEVPMALEFCFPDVGEGITEGEVVRWLVKQGDTVRTDQPLVEVETDKAVVEIPAPQAGTILRLTVGEGEKIYVGNVLVVIGDPEEDAADQASSSRSAHPIADGRANDHRIGREDRSRRGGA